MTITTPNGFKIGPSTTEIRGVSKVTLAMNNPVLQGQNFGWLTANSAITL